MKPKPRYQPGDKIGGRYLVHQALIVRCFYMDTLTNHW